MNDLIISLSILVVAGFCFLFIPDYGTSKSKQMNAIRLLFVLALIAICFYPLPISYVPHAVKVLISMFLTTVVAMVFFMIFSIVGWIFSIKAEDIINKIAGVKP